jgi:hypothetical protein
MQGKIYYKCGKGAAKANMRWRCGRSRAGSQVKQVSPSPNNISAVWFCRYSEIPVSFLKLSE